METEGMADNYDRIVMDNLHRLYTSLPPDLERNLPGRREGDRFVFDAFGETCRIEPAGIALGDRPCPSILGILISLYALHARPDSCIVEPLKAFREMPGSMPYTGAFAANTEQLLVPRVSDIEASRRKIMETLEGGTAPEGTGGDFSFMVYPFPKIALCYIFYEADADFPASVTCLFSNNAQLFLPVDGLADTGEYCSKKILELVL